MRVHGFARFARLAATAALLAVLAGCFEYKESITVRPDGSGTVEITAWISEKAAQNYRPSDLPGAAPPPVSKGVVEQLMSGSGTVNLVQHDIRLEGDRWNYRVRLDFDNVRSLSEVRYFSRRDMRLYFPSAKELGFREDISPSLFQQAKDVAKTLATDPYAKPFLAVADSANFPAVVEGATISYSVTLPGISATAPEGIVTRGEGDMFTLTREFKMSDFLKAGPPQLVQVTTALPAEYSFTVIVVILLLASIIGILVPAVRLIIIKTHGSA